MKVFLTNRQVISWEKLRKAGVKLFSTVLYYHGYIVQNKNECHRDFCFKFKMAAKIQDGCPNAINLHIFASISLRKVKFFFICTFIGSRNTFLICFKTLEIKMAAKIQNGCLKRLEFYISYSVSFNLLKM